MSAKLWDEACKLTCIGGSEVGTCECSMPSQCALKSNPEFGRRRARARDRMADHFGLPRELLRGIGEN